MNEMLSLRSPLPRFCTIYSRCSAYDVPERTRAKTLTSLLCHIFCPRCEKNFPFSVAEPEQEGFLDEETGGSLLRLLLSRRGHRPRLTRRLVRTRLRRSMTRTPSGFFESGQNSLEKGILNEPEDRLRGAGLGILQFPGDRGHRRDFSAGSIFQYPRDPTNQPLIDVVHESFVFILARIIGLHVLEQRLDIAGDLTVFDLEFGIEGEKAIDDIKVPVGPP